MKKLFTFIGFIIWYFRTIHVLKKKNIKVEIGALINSNTKLEIFTKIKRGTRIKNSTVKKGTYIEKNCILNDCSIGAFSSIGVNVSVIYGRHPVNTFVSTHPAFFSNKKQAGFSFVKDNIFQEHKFSDSLNNLSVTIGNDVWVGSNVNILEGVKIGDGAIIGACSLVTKDVEPYSINVGIPSKQIGKRFNQEDIDFLLNFKWWETDFDWLNNHSTLFTDIDLLKKTTIYGC